MQKKLRNIIVVCCIVLVSGCASKTQSSYQKGDAIWQQQKSQEALRGLDKEF